MIEKREKQPQQTEEYLDVVNANDEVIDRKPRSAIYKEHASNFRVVNAFGINSKGQLWIPQRTPHKKIFPNALDFSMGGHVESGESYPAAFKRETGEELGIDVDAKGYRVLGKLTPEQDGVVSFMQVYEFPLGKTPVYNPNDFSGSHWFYPDELRAEIQKGTPAKSDLIIVLNRFYPAS